MVQPHKPGQWVRNTRTGSLGITTEEPMKRTPRIAVMMEGARWVVNGSLEDLEVIPTPVVPDESTP